MIEIDVTIDNRLPASMDKLAGNFFDDIVEGVIHPYLEDVASRARREHRHNRRTGALERSISVDKTSDGGSVYIDDSIAPHGKHIHDGHRSWAADEFIYDAQDDRALDMAIDRELDNIIKKAGL